MLLQRWCTLLHLNTVSYRYLLYGVLGYTRNVWQSFLKFNHGLWADILGLYICNKENYMVCPGEVKYLECWFLIFSRWLQAIEEFSICTIEDKKSLLLHNLDPMFNIKSARFFQGKAENLFEQLNNFCVFDTRHLVQTENATEAPTLKWNQFFRTPWANSVEVDICYILNIFAYFSFHI